MLQLLTAPDVAVFTAALLLMVAIGIVEAIGLGASGIQFDVGLDLDHGGALGWLGIGHVPVLVVLIAFLAAFGIVGLAGQQIAISFTGMPVSGWIAAPVAFVTALPFTSMLARTLARVIPHDETSAVDVGDLVGRIGTITVGCASAGSPARTRVVDLHGQPHHVLVEPNDPALSFVEGDTVLLVRREGHHFRAVAHGTPTFSSWIE